MAYRIAEGREVPYVVWERDPVTVTADEALSPMQDAPRSAREDAAEFLTQLLGRDQVPVDDIKNEGKLAGFTWATLRRAKDEIGAKSKKAGYAKAEWTWYLPPSKQPNSKVLTSIHTRLSTYAESEHLRGSRDSIGAIDAQDNTLSTFEDAEHLLDLECAAAEYAARRGE